MDTYTNNFFLCLTFLVLSLVFDLLFKKIILDSNKDVFNKFEKSMYLIKSLYLSILFITISLYGYLILLMNALVIYKSEQVLNSINSNYGVLLGIIVAIMLYDTVGSKYGKDKTKVCLNYTITDLKKICNVELLNKIVLFLFIISTVVYSIHIFLPKYVNDILIIIGYFLAIICILILFWQIIYFILFNQRKVLQNRLMKKYYLIVDRKIKRARGDDEFLEYWMIILNKYISRTKKENILLDYSELKPMKFNVKYNIGYFDRFKSSLRFTFLFMLLFGSVIYIIKDLFLISLHFQLISLLGVLYFIKCLVSDSTILKHYSAESIIIKRNEYPDKFVHTRSLLCFSKTEKMLRSCVAIVKYLRRFKINNLNIIKNYNDLTKYFIICIISENEIEVAESINKFKVIIEEKDKVNIRHLIDVIEKVYCS